MMDEKLVEISRRARISDYLRSRGIDLLQTRRGFKCACPLPKHQDDTPSFYVTTMPDGGECFRCFGCGSHGGIIALIHAIEGTPKGAIVRRLSDLHGIKGGGFERIERFDPTHESVLAAFCQEDQRAHDIAERCLLFVESQGGREDAVNKVEKVYQVMDRMIEEGDAVGLVELEKRLKLIIMESTGLTGDDDEPGDAVRGDEEVRGVRPEGNVPAGRGGGRTDREPQPADNRGGTRRE